MAEKNGVKAIAAFVERGQGKAIVELYANNQIEIRLVCRGSGTASSELMDVLGLGTSEKDIIIGIASKGNVENLMHKLMEDSDEQIDARGIMFDLKLTGLNSMIATVLLHQGQNGQDESGNGGAVMEQSKAHSMVFVIVNQGYTDEVMDTARGAGARGGTIIRARWAGDNETEHFYGINIQEEKEIIAIITHTENRNAIMETINKKHGLETEACALVCSLGIDHVARI